ncbi:uncharacterized [Tachysurus ichikawai]
MDATILRPVYRSQRSMCDLFACWWTNQNTHNTQDLIPKRRTPVPQILIDPQETKPNQADLIGNCNPERDVQRRTESLSSVCLWFPRGLRWPQRMVYTGEARGAAKHGSLQLD